jgi:hypothetical protein
MFEAADAEQRCSKAEWRREEPLLRERLLASQVRLGQQRPRAVLVIVGGVDGAGKSEVVHQLNEWMDPRYIQTHRFGEPGDEGRERPPMWRYWRVLPPRARSIRPAPSIGADHWMLGTAHSHPGRPCCSSSALMKPVLRCWQLGGASPPSSRPRIP